MTIDEYQTAALKTAIYPTDKSIVYPTLGLTGESGEVADKVKKVLRDNNGEFTEDKCREIALELGDVMWYCAAMARDLGYTLEEVASMNIQKLKSRSERNAIHGNGDHR